MRLAWEAPAPAAKTRPMKSKKISVLVENLWKDGVQRERLGRVEGVGNPPEELTEGHWGEFIGLCS